MNEYEQRMAFDGNDECRKGFTRDDTGGNREMKHTGVQKGKRAMKKKPATSAEQILEGLSNNQGAHLTICTCQEFPVADGEDHCRHCIATAELANSSVECFICRDEFRHEKMYWDSTYSLDIGTKDPYEEVPVCSKCLDDLLRRPRPDLN